MSARDVGQQYAGEIDDGKIRDQVESICASQTFRRSEQSQRFLRFICDLALKGEASRINEYLIGLEVFGRGNDYSTAEDAIVRRQAHTLRRKLDSYYANEGRGDRVRVELPVGGYEPAFRLQPAEEGSESPVEAAPGSTRQTYTLLLPAILLIALGWMLGRSFPEPAGASPSAATQELWGDWLRDSSGATICFANSTAALVHRIADESTPDRHPLHFRPAPEAERALRQYFRLPEGGYLYYRPSDTKTSIAESISAVHIAELFGRSGTPIRATQSQLLNWEELRKGSFILLGHNESNPWVDKLLHKAPLRLGDSQGVQRFIQNPAPREGERARYAKEASASGADPNLEYALVSMLPGVNERHRTLLISGLDGEATRMATETLTQNDRVEELLKRLRAADPSHSGPWYFQFVLRAEVREKLATRAEIVALRIIRPDQ